MNKRVELLIEYQELFESDSPPPWQMNVPALQQPPGAHRLYVQSSLRKAIAHFGFRMAALHLLHNAASLISQLD